MDKDDRLIYLLSRAQHRLTEYMKKTYSGARISVSPIQAGILFLLKKNESMSMSDISQVLGVDNSAITGMVDRLEKGGFVSRMADPHDRRKNMIHITEKGTIEISRTKALTIKVNSLIKEGFTDAEIDLFKRVLNSFFDKFK